MSCLQMKAEQVVEVYETVRNIVNIMDGRSNLKIQCNIRQNFDEKYETFLETLYTLNNSRDN